MAKLWSFMCRRFIRDDASSKTMWQTDAAMGLVRFRKDLNWRYRIFACIIFKARLERHHAPITVRLWPVLEIRLSDPR